MRDWVTYPKLQYVKPWSFYAPRLVNIWHCEETTQENNGLFKFYREKQHANSILVNIVTENLHDFIKIKQPSILRIYPTSR